MMMMMMMLCIGLFLIFLSFKISNNVSNDTLSNIEDDSSGLGIYIDTPDYITKCQFRNDTDEFKICLKHEEINRKFNKIFGEEK